MTNKKIIAIIQAFVDGKKIEFKRRRENENENEWENCIHPIWNFYTFDYRIKPVEYWVNIYDWGTGELHETKEKADNMTLNGRIKCIHLAEVF